MFATSLAACSEGRAKPDATAAALAKGLSSLDLGGVPLSAVTKVEAAQQLSSAIEGMGGLRPSVRVRSTRVGKDKDTASAVLAIRWDLDASDQDWTYTTTAPLTFSKDTWSVGWSPAVLESSLVAGDRLVVTKRDAKRGEILGAGGVALVTIRRVLRVGIDRTKVAPEQAGASAQRLAEQLPGVDVPRFVDRVAKAGAKAFVEATVLRADGPSPVDPQRVAEIPGAVLIPDERQLAPTRDFARPILGTFGEATADLIASSRGRLRAGDSTGLSGLQASRDEVLRGQPGFVVQAVPSEGTDAKPRDLYRRDPTPGKPVATTLDTPLQTLADGLLAPVVSPSAIVAVRPSTGDVLAAASGPGGRGYSTATLGRYAPGSAFKVVTALGLLRAGLGRDSVVSCTPTITVDGRSFKNYDDYPPGGLGDIALRTAIANSCNTAMIASSDKVSQAALSKAAAGLGLGVKRDFGVPFFAGSVPEQAGATEHAASMIGQGRVQASPLAMAVVAASIAAGKAVVPRLLGETPPATVVADQPVGASEAAELRMMMRAVVTDGSGGFLRDVPGDEVAAKTGTAEYGKDQPPRTHAWMIAVQGDLAIAVFVEDGASGAKTAGPILEQFLRGAR